MPTLEHDSGSPSGLQATATAIDTPASHLTEKAAEAGSVSPRWALIVDDSPTDRLILCHLMAKFGFKTVEAFNGIEALERLGQHPEIELMLVDWNMPQMTGLDFVKEVRSNENYTPVPIIMVTVREQMDFVIEAVGAGANEYLMKPYTLEGLESKLRLIGITAS